MPAYTPTPPPPPPPPPDSPALGIVMPGAASQSTSVGRSISTLGLIDGQVYAGYGDYGANTGPIHLESVPAASPLGAWTDHVVADSEQIGVYRPTLDGRILVPHIDPRNTGGGTGGGYSQRAADGTWTDLPNRIGSSEIEHVFDIVEFDGDLWACGADNHSPFGGAAIWRSTDAGATWTESLTGPRCTAPSGVQRFYCFVIAAGILRVREAVGGQSYKWNGAAWVTDTVNPLPTLIVGVPATGGPGQPWDGGYVNPSSLPFGSGPYDLYLFDGATTITLLEAATGFSIGDDGNLYALKDATIHRIAPTTHAVTTAAAVGEAATETNSALCVLPGSTQAVVGTSDSRLKLIDLV